MIRFQHVTVSKKRPRTFTLKHTPMSKLLLCQAFTIHLVLKSVSWPLQWSQLPAWGPSSAAETHYLLTPQGSRPESKKTNYLRSSSSQWQVGMARKHPSCSLRRVPQSRLLFMASRVPHWHQEPMVPGVTGLTICFSSVYPLLPSLATFPLLFVSVQLTAAFSHVLVWDLLLRELRPRQEPEESWWTWEFWS